MQARATVSWLLALTLVAGLVIAPPAAADDAPPVVDEVLGELPEDGVGDDDTGDGAGGGGSGGEGSGDEGGGEGDGDAVGGPDDAGTGGFGPMAFGDLTGAVGTEPLGPIAPQVRALDLAFAEPQTLYSALDFPTPENQGDWDSENATAERRDVSVRNAIAADVNGDGHDDAISLVYVRNQPPMAVGLRAPGRAFVTAGPDPALGGWYVVVHLMSPGVGLLSGTPYPVGTASDEFVGMAAVGDVDGDDAPDIVFSKRGEQSVIALINDREGAFPDAVTTPLDRSLDRGFVLADLDDDGSADLIAPVGGTTFATADDGVLILRGAPDGKFTAGADLEAVKPANAAVIDADGQGAQELLITSFDDATPVSLWRWSYPGDGADWADGWAKINDALPNIKAVAAWVGDFDGKNNEDAALLLRYCDAERQGRCLVPLRNDGSGTFTALDPVASTYLTVFDTGHLELVFPYIDGTTADVDGDGYLDIVMPGALGEVGIAFGDGHGSFPDLRTVAGAAGWEPEAAGGWDSPTEAGGSWPANWGTELQAMSAAVLDGTGDGVMDLLVGTAGGNYLTYAGDATGRLSLVPGLGADTRGFAAADAWGISDERWEVGLASAQPVLVDATGDGHDDIVFLRDSDSGAEVMLAGWDDGRFAPTTAMGTVPASCAGWSSGRLVVADIVGDEAVDVVCSDSSKVYLARGSLSDPLGTANPIGDLTALSPKGERIDTIVATDLDGDGDLDIVFSAGTILGQSFSGTAFGWIENLGDTDGFASAQWLQQSGFNDGDHSADTSLPHGPVIADLTGDGLADFAIAARSKSSAGVYELFVYVNEGVSDGPLAFTARDTLFVNLNSNDLGAGFLDAGDLTGDGVTDLILTGMRRVGSQEYGSRMTLLVGTRDTETGLGTGELTQGMLFPPGAAWPGHRIADLNGDGHADLISPTGYRGIELRAGHADGSLGTPQVFGTPGAAIPWVQVTDATGDGALDVIGVVAHSGPGVGQLAVLRNLGGGAGPGGDTDPPCHPSDEDCDPACDPGDEDCDDDGGDPPAPATVNLVADAPEWSGAATLDAITSGTVTVTVRNTGTAATTGTWVDSLWLSADSTWSADDMLLKAIPRTSAIAAGGSVEIGIPVTLAPPAAGPFHLIVRADTRGEVTEARPGSDDAPVPAEDDNDAATELTFDPPILEIPASGDHPGATTTVTGPGAVVLIPEIRDGTSAVRLTVTGAEVDGFTVRTGKLPTATVADQRIVGAGSATLLPGDERYLRIDLGAGESATVTATRLEFGVGSVAPKRVSVGGPVSFVLSGVGLGSLNSAWAIGPDGDEIPATALMRHSSGELTVTFDLTGQEAGTFGLNVASTDTSATLDGAFVAVADRVGGVRTSVLIPSTLRSGTVGEVWITYANDGLTDAVAPILRVSSRGVKPTDTSPYQLGRFYVSPSVPWAPVGVIPAGASGRIVIPFLVDPDGPDGLPNLPPDGNQYTFYVEEFGIDSVAPYNAAADFADELLALDGDTDATESARIAIALELTARLGETGGSYLAAMHRLRAALDLSTADMDDLRDKMFENVVGVFGSGAVHGTLTKSGGPVADVGLQIDVPAGTDGAGARTVETRTDETGAWFARGLTEATGAVVRVDGYGPGPIMGLPDLSASSTVNLTLPDWQPLSGTVTGLDGLFAPDVVVTVQSGDGTQWVRAVTDADGVYRFDGIAPGTHRLMAAGMDGGLAITDLTMGDAAITKNLTLQSTGIAADGGSVTGTLPPMPITAVLGDVEIPDSVSIWVDDGASLRPIETETDGSFTVVGTPGTHATLWLFDAFYGVRSAAVTFPAAGARVGAAWTTSDRTLAIPVTVTTGDELPQVYLQLAASADYVPIPGADAGVLLVPSGLDGDPVTWTDETSAGDRGMLSVANLPPGDYRVTVIDSDGEDIAEFSVAAGDVAVSFGARPESVTASGTATHNGTTVVGGFVELVSTNLSPARRHVAPTGGPDTDPPGTAGAWSVSVVVGEYDVRYFDASGTLLYSEVKSFLEGSPLRMSGRAFAHAPTTASVAGRSSYLLSRSASAVSAFSTDGEYAPQGGSKAELEAIYQAKFDSGTVPTPDPMVGQALAMPYPNQPPPDECKALDTSWLAAAKIAASTAASTREMIDQLIRDTRKTKAWMFGEAALRAVMFLGEISNLVLGVIAVKQAVGKAAATAAAREEAKVLAAKGIKPPPPTGIIDLQWQPVLENIQKVSSLGSTIYTNAKTAITSAEPAVAGNVVGMLGEIGNLALELSKDIGIMATSAAVSLVRDVIGPIAAINNMITQVREAGESYRSAIAQLDNMKAALDQLYVSYDFDLGQAHQAWFDFQANRFPEISLDSEECKEGDGGDDEDPKGPGEDPDDPNDPAGPKEPTKPTGPKPGPKQPTGPTGGRTLGSMDPNEIVGPAGVGSERWLQVGTVLGYRISFENLGPGSLEIPDDQEMATAPAATVTVAFPLPDAALVDSVELGDFGFGAGDGAVRYVPDPGATSYEREDYVSMTVPSVLEGEGDVSLDLVRRARGWLDRDGREVHWEITLVDKTTGLPHSNPAAGFLPPEPGGDNAGAGQGWATVSFATDAAAPVDARASIVFDTNDPILTNIWSNRLDGTAPSTSMSGASTTVVGQTAAVTLNDAGGSGAGLVDIWRSVDDGPLRLWRYQVPPGPQVMLGEPGQRIGLAARSTDRVGNAEHPPSAIQFSTTLKAAPRPGGPTPGGPTPGGIDPGQPGATPQADRCAVKPFLDVRIGDAFCGEIAWLKSTGITKGYGSGAFGATAAVSRGAMAAFLYRLQHPGADKPVCSTAPFPDVSVDSAFCGEIAWLKSTGITVGYSDGKFHATRAVSRSAMAAFLYRLHHPTTAPVGCAAQPFRDVPRAAEFCAEITWLTVEGLTTGFSDGTYRGLLPVSRGAMAAFLYRLEHAND